jgi:hypothetical protein
MHNTSTVKFGALHSPKPQWATWMFRSVAILTTVISFWIGATQLITDEAKVEIVLALKSFDMLTLGFSNLFGIVIPEKTQS